MTGRGGDRGQINFDFAVGVSIVIVSVVIAFSLVPSVFGGVTEGRQQSDEVVADRIAEDLVEDSLEGPRNPGTLDTTCVQALFGYSPAYDCGFSGTTVPEKLGVEDRFVNVSIRRGETLQCWDGSEIDDKPAGGCTNPLFDGDNTGGAEQIGISQRAVTVDGDPVEIVVRVW